MFFVVYTDAAGRQFVNIWYKADYHPVFVLRCQALGNHWGFFSVHHLHKVVVFQDKMLAGNGRCYSLPSRLDDSCLAQNKHKRHLRKFLHCWM